MHMYTIGHSNRSLEDLLLLLREFDIKLLVDIRRFPSSRKFPHFNRKALLQTLNSKGIDYLWQENLGGYRQHKESPRQSGLKSKGFRSYAEHMNSQEFLESIAEIIKAGGQKKTCLMCAEKLFWKCHRFLLSDYLGFQGIKVVHILDSNRYYMHRISAEAGLNAEGEIVYTEGDKYL